MFQSMCSRMVRRIKILALVVTVIETKFLNINSNTQFYALLVDRHNKKTSMVLEQYLQQNKH